MTSFLVLLLSCSAAGAVFAGIVWLLGALAGGKLPKACLHLAWILVWLRFVLPIPTLLPMQSLPQSVQSVVEAVQEETLAADAVEMPETIVPIVPENLTQITPQEPIQSAPEESIPGMAELPVTQPVRSASPFPWVKVLFGIWLAGVAGSLAYHLLSYHRLSRELIATAMEPDAADLAEFRTLCPDSRLRLLVHGKVGTALHIGLLRPVILLPEAGYVQSGRRNVLQLILRHEYTHYKRGDLWLKWFAMLTSCLHWFNPVVYLILRPWNEACEFACDEAVLSHLSPKEQLLYGETILETHRNLSRITRSVTASFLGSGRNYLRERIHYIADFSKTNARRHGAAAVVVLAALTLCACILGPAPLEAEPKEDMPLPTATISATVNPDPTPKPTAAPTTAADPTPTPIATFPPFTMPGPAGDRPKATLSPDSELPLLQLPEGVEDRAYPEIPTWKYTLEAPSSEQMVELAERSAELFFEGKAQKTENKFISHEYKLPDRDTEFGPFYEGLSLDIPQNIHLEWYLSLNYSARWLDVETTPYFENMEPVDLSEEEAVQIAWEFLEKMGWDAYASGEAETIERGKEWDIRWKKLSLSDGQYDSIIIFMINGHIYSASLDISNLVPVFEDPPESILSLSEALYCLNYARSQVKSEDDLFFILHDYPVLSEVTPAFAIDSMAYTKPDYDPDGPDCYVPCWRFDMKPLKPYSPWIRQTIYVNALTGEVMTDTNDGGWPSPYEID